jgi:uncharacterized membrane-anchored protein
VTNDQRHKRPVRRRSPAPRSRIPNWLFYGIIIVVTLLWAGFIVLGALTQVQMPTTLNTVFPIVVITVLGGKAVGDARGDKDNDGGGDDE